MKASAWVDNNITFKEPVHINKTKNNKYQISSSERKIIERLFAKDFQILGYNGRTMDDIVIKQRANFYMMVIRRSVL